MKTYIRNPFIVPALIAGIALTLAGRVTAQTFTTLHSFTATNPQIRGTNNDGASPNGLFLSGSTLYGTTCCGGTAGNGTVFRLSFTPQLTITRSGDNVILTWPTNYAGFDYTGFTLQSTTNLVSSALWTTVFPGPVVINGQNAVTNPI